jgi:3alpha(or 20beta)-hydroxysteroid dehydrogenase
LLPTFFYLLIEMNTRFNNQVVLITGAVGALGEVMAHAFAKEGATVVVAARREAEGIALAKAVGNQALFVPLDVTEEASWTAAIAHIESQVGPVSVLINNAAYLAVGAWKPCRLRSGTKLLLPT